MSSPNTDAEHKAVGEFKSQLDEARALLYSPREGSALRAIALQLDAAGRLIATLLELDLA